MYNNLFLDFYFSLVHELNHPCILKLIFLIHELGKVVYLEMNLVYFLTVNKNFTNLVYFIIVNKNFTVLLVGVKITAVDFGFSFDRGGQVL